MKGKEQHMTTTLYVIAVVTGFMAVGIGLWAIATLTVELALMKRKRRPRRGTPKRQGKFYNIIVTDGEEGRK
jgi:hypothetical protein